MLLLVPIRAVSASHMGGRVTASKQSADHVSPDEETYLEVAPHPRTPNGKVQDD